MHPTLQTALAAFTIHATWRYPTRTWISGSHRKERDPDTSRDHHSPRPDPDPSRTRRRGHVT